MKSIKEPWFEHYSKKYDKIEMDDHLFKDWLKDEEKYLKVVSEYVKPNCKILESGCGLGRTAIFMSRMGYKVTAIDDNKKMLDLAKNNAKKFGKNIKFKLVDLENVDKFFKKNSFDAITHQGILEHFPPNNIKEIIKKELKIAPLVIFSVPILSERNKKYFKGGLIKYRNLWNINFWERILKDFNVVEIFEAKQRKDDLIVVIKRS